MIKRTKDIESLRRLLGRNPVVGIVGARQVGKTTLARTVARGWDGKTSYFDLEDPRDSARLADPMLALERLEGLVIIDEIQRLPGLFEVLRVLVDRPRRRSRGPSAHASSTP